MSQVYSLIEASQQIKDSRSVINGNIESLRSNFSGSEFPSNPSPVEGQNCFKDGIEYVYHNNEWMIKSSLHVHDDRYYTESEMDTKLAAKASSSHIHDDRYYTEDEVDSLIAGVSGAAHSHNDQYYTEAEVDLALANKANTSTTVTQEKLQKQSHNYVTSTGYSTGYVGAFSPAITALLAGTKIKFKAHVSNSANATFQANSTSATAIKEMLIDGSLSNIRPGIIKAGQIVELTYNGAYWILPIRQTIYTDDIFIYAVTTAKINEQAITGAKLAAITAGDYHGLFVDATERYWSNCTSYTLKWAIQINRTGSVRLRFTFRNSSGSPYYSRYRIYKNGVYTEVSGETNKCGFEPSYSWVSVIHDISVYAGDTIQLYVMGDHGTAFYMKDAMVTCTDPLQSIWTIQPSV